MLHVVSVDAYEGELEPLSNDPTERSGASGLGLPWDDLAPLLDADVTVLDWDDWYDYEVLPGSFSSWTTFPATRRAVPFRLPSPTGQFDAPRVRRRSIPALDPEHRSALATSAMSPRAYGLLAEGDPLFFVAVELRAALEALHRERPIDLLVLPAWGGLGAVLQLDRATAGGPLAGTGIAVVATGLSRDRMAANEEGGWTRMAIARRQREELSIALADCVVTFGDRSEHDARLLGLRDATPPVVAPRRVVPAAIGAVANVIAPGAAARAPQFFVAGLEDGASGALLALDAARLLSAESRAPAGGIRSAGADARFGPMTPGTFREYWSRRGWVRELVERGEWTWATEPPNDPTRLSVRLWPGRFAHLPNLWTDLAAGILPVMTPAVAEGLAPGVALPAPVLLDESPTARSLANRVAELAALPPAELERLRSAVAGAAVGAHRGEEWNRRLAATARALRTAVRSAERPSLARVFRRQLDPRRPLFEADQAPSPVRPQVASPATLTVVVACYEMGALLEQTVESIWRSSRVPDEVLLVDDGSRGEATALTLAALAAKAARDHRPLTVIKQRNRGLSGARNAGLEAARGEYVSFIDGDDLIAPTFYRLALDLLDREPGLGAVAGWAELFGDGAPDGFWNAPEPELPLMLVENLVFVPAVARTALVRSLGGYDESQRYNYEDWELAIRFLARGHPIVVIPRYLQRYRVRGDSLLRTMTDIQHQTMIERLYATHGETAGRFGMEISLQLEHRLAKDRYPRSSPAAEAAPEAQIPILNVRRNGFSARAAARMRSMLRRAVRAVTERGGQ